RGVRLRSARPWIQSTNFRRRSSFASARSGTEGSASTSAMARSRSARRRSRAARSRSGWGAFPETSRWAISERRSAVRGGATRAGASVGEAPAAGACGLGVLRARAGEDLEHRAHARVLGADRVQGGPVQLEDVAGGGGGDGGCPRPPGEGRDLAEERALADLAQGYVAVLRREHEDLHAAGGQDEHALARLPLRDDDVARLEGGEAQAAADSA